MLLSLLLAPFLPIVIVVDGHCCTLLTVLFARLCCYLLFIFTWFILTVIVIVVTVTAVADVVHCDSYYVKSGSCFGVHGVQGCGERASTQLLTCSGRPTTES